MAGSRPPVERQNDQVAPRLGALLIAIAGEDAGMTD
jgi:hypothetical protein